ncbi:hypothetical protein A1O3_01227 [Capronia epimyces CBS 606.96]|uniref:Zn(2)-C6 fungal-type domain-containing protein n=1 Tax=Capronia epimyces CBS 606.96 TaxID=1182542 RepID=W9YSM5_9EURO|nr:uncharacterized protein A1O3_01227 [Capronia epimyces CBS 606.96]EXJ92675.1 hypothetical protein A1O3_01227 [Capronia epimyces CBS 606.96]
MASETFRLKGKPRGVRRDRDCLTCKRRQVKCDLNRPGCEICKDAGLKCQGYRVTVKWVDDGKQQRGAPRPSKRSRRTTTTTTTTTTITASSDTTSPRSSVDDVDIQSINWTTDISSALQYFAAKLDLGRCQSALSPTSAPSPNTDDMSDIWKFAWKRTASHVGRPDKNVNDDDDPQFLHLAALSALSRMVRAGHIFAIFGITTFAFLDVREGPFGDWGRHLQGARALLNIHCGNLAEFTQVCDSTPGLQQAVSLLNWYDVMGSVVHQDRQLVFDAFHREYMDDSLFELTGCERETFQLYINVVHRREPHSFDMEKLYHLTVIQLLKLQTQHDDQDSSQQSLIRDAWRLGAVLACVGRSAFSSECLLIVTMVIDKLCTIISTIRQNNEAYLHLALPVYLIGVHGTKDKHQAQVKLYWSFFNCRKVPEYPHAQELCDHEREREKNRRSKEALS